MESKKIKLDFDFKKIIDNINTFLNRTMPDYFKGLSMDMLIAWGVLGVGLLLIIIGIVML